MRLLSKCRFNSIQRAVNAAHNGYRIKVLPGSTRRSAGRTTRRRAVRTSTRTRARCHTTSTAQCPNAQNLIAILGDTNNDRICDSKCNLQIEGTGDNPEDVKIEGEKLKLNVVRADRADGIFLKNFQVEFSDFNNIYVLETNGFHLDGIVSKYSREYGILSFTSDHGIYENCDASYSGDSGVYPGSGPNARHGQPDAHGHVYGIEIRNCDSHHNTIGMSGTAGNGTWAHDNRFRDNSAGTTTDSFAGGHPGMPQDNSKYSHNLIYSNNNDLFNAERDAYCQQVPWEDRDPQKVCPTFQVPVGTGNLIAGGNANIVEENYIFDNWRRGTMLHWVPAALRGEQDAAKTYDTSSNNRYTRNCMGVRPASLVNVNFATCAGTQDKNGVDFWWDEEEGQDCIEEQAGCVDNDSVKGQLLGDQHGLRRHVHERPDPDAPAGLPRDSTRPVPATTRSRRTLVPCATWNPQDNTGPARVRLVHAAARAVGPCWIGVSVRAWTPGASHWLSLVVVALLAGCGDDKPAKDALAWFDTPNVIVPPTLKGDRILQAEVRNDSDQKVRVEAGTIRVFDDRGRRGQGIRDVRRGIPPLALPAHARAGHAARLRARAPRQAGRDRAREDGQGHRVLARAARAPHRCDDRLRAGDADDPAREPAPRRGGPLGGQSSRPRRSATSTACARERTPRRR